MGIRIGVLYPGQVVRAGIMSALDGSEARIAWAFNSAAGFEYSRLLDIDVLVIGTSIDDMPTERFLALVKVMVKTIPPVVIIGIPPAKPSAIPQLLQNGVCGLVQSNFTKEELIASLIAAKSFREFCRQAIYEPVPKGKWGKEKNLTARQLEILELVACGKTAKEIAVFLSISPKTVEFHKFRIKKVLSVRSTTEMAVHALKCGLVKVGPAIASAFSINKSISAPTEIQ